MDERWKDQLVRTAKVIRIHGELVRGFLLRAPDEPLLGKVSVSLRVALQGRQNVGEGSRGTARR